jgi:soluble lytic murein transglycosylase-like protein
MRLLKGIMHCLVLFFVCLQGVCMAATPVNNRDRDVIKEMISKVEIQYKIPAGLLGAIAKVESGTRKYAVNVNGRAIYAATLVEATTIAKEQISRGKTNIDLGVMQLNYRWHGDQFSSLEEMLIPKKNIAYAGVLLRSLYRQHGDWQKAIRHYHSANLKHSRKYSRKVTMAWLSL